jgi:hypothetical protein
MTGCRDVVRSVVAETGRCFRCVYYLHHQCDKTKDDHLQTCRRENLKTHTVYLYGESTLRYVRGVEVISQSST